MFGLAYGGVMESITRVWGAMASRFSRKPRDERASVASRPSIEPLDFPEDTAPASDAQLKLDWFSTDLYSFALDKFRQG